MRISIQMLIGSETIKHTSQTRMKYTKVIIALVLAGVFALAPATLAAEKKGKKKPAAGEKAKGKRPADPILEKLGLSDDQKKEYLALKKATAEKRKAAGKDKEAQKEVQQGHMAALKEILTEEQQAQLKKIQAEMRKGKGGKGDGKGKGKGKGKKKSED